MECSGNLTHVVPDTLEVSELKVGIKVDLDNTVGDGNVELLLAGTGTTVEDQEQGLVLRSVDLLLGVGLVLAQKLGVELDVTRLVDTVNVAESSGNGEVGGDRGESGVDIVDVLRLGVERVVVNSGVVDTILLTTGDTDLHLEPLLHGGSTLEVLPGDGNVLILLLLRKIDHVRREQRLAVGLEVGLISVQHAVQPGKQLLGAVIGVEDDGDAVCRRNGADVVGSGDGTVDGRELVGVGDTLAGEVGGTTLGNLQDDGGLGVAGSLERGNDGGGRGDVLGIGLA